MREIDAVEPDARSDQTVIGRAEAILTALEGESAVPLAELTRRTGLPKPTVRRLANSLTQRGVLDRRPDGYRIGRSVLRRALCSPQQSTTLTVLPYLQELHALSRGQVVWYAGVHSGELLVEEAVFGHLRPPFERTQPWRSPVRCFGDSLALTAIGQLQLAHDPGASERLLHRGCPSLTRYSDTDPHRLRARLARARDTGFASENEQVRLGWSCAAAAIDDGSGTLTGALVILGRGHIDTVRGLRHRLQRHAQLLAGELPHPAR